MLNSDLSSSSKWLQPHNLLRLSVVVALLTIVLKTLAWWLTGSVGLLSDALESFVNLAGAMFALTMVTVAKRPADTEHPYGHYKAEYFSAGFEGVLVIGASLAIAWAALSRLWNPQPLEQLSWGLMLSLLSTVFNGLLAWVMLRSSRKYRSMALEGDARHLLTDVWTSVGVVVGLLAAALTGWLWVDAAVALAVAVHICVQGVQLVWQSSQGLMDQALDAPQRLRIDTLLDSFARRSEGVSFDNISSRQAGERSFVDFHMHVPGQWSVQRAAQLRSEIEAALLQAIPGLYARIELLPMGMNTVSEVADGEQGGEAQGAAREGFST
ncbi:cation diffusion facilitator family transporter [Comamonas testosteroni]|jgi:divalent metal cation (Fe/Co/Zn/Cd) transporter|uniref:Cation diffusion facilitator family transporter n=2 Tax=Comamonas testosteroni TaxID=285 RepID=B7WS83_COMTK|nr:MULTISPECIES: cation diffusion facilitator family transporter [Comamonas]AIJ49188.1 cation diffusion facilitator family transporter [Comamonas testosteroni TK102]EED65341.1 cation diffusion facilitator family transporter [Comamonas testosteroni KF-1]MPS89146.1 cation transporter [Comamonas sp.]TYK70674.1 cation transporter [Comamonas sp. Z3]WQG68752.1 cation diffusion facilitator family transporter [Comamonas testosteroni]